MAIINEFLVTYLSRVVNAISIIGKVRNLTEPIMTFVDWSLNYHDFKLRHELPLEKNRGKKTIYIYSKNDQIFYNYYKEGRITEKNIDPKEFGEESYNSLKQSLVSDLNINITTTKNLYQFIRDKEFKPGIKYWWNKNIASPYKKLENFIKKTPLYVAYKFTGRAVNNLLILGSNEYFLKAFGLAVMIGCSVATGGTFAIAVAAVYGVGVGISLVNKTLNRKNFNSLKYEANLLEKYTANMNLMEQNGIGSKFKKDQAPEATSRYSDNWLYTSARSIASESLETVIPLVVTGLSPISTAVSLVSYTIFVVASSIGLGLSVNSFKNFREKVKYLDKKVAEIKAMPEVPSYNNLKDLEKLVSVQDNLLKLHNIQNESPSLSKAFLKKDSFFKALCDTLNPYDKYKFYADITDYSLKNVQKANKNLNDTKGLRHQKELKLEVNRELLGSFTKEKNSITKTLGKYTEQQQMRSDNSNIQNILSK